MRSLSFVVVLLLALVPTTHLQAQGGELRVLAPVQGEQVQGDSFGIYVETPGITIVPSSVKLEEAGKRPEANRPGQGHLHFMLDLQPLVIWDKTEPYVFTNVTPGNHVVMIEIVQNDHSSFTPPLIEQIQFTAAAAPVGVPAPESPPVAAPTPSSPIPSVMPNTGFALDGAQMSPYALLAIGGLLVLIGGGIRRRTPSWE